jgi:predicted MFS family arabinose efflux permease
MLLWAGAALNTVNGVPYLMKLSRVEERDYTFAAQASVFALGAFLGSLVAGLLPGLLSEWLDVSLELPLTYRLSLWVAPIAFLVAALAILQVRPVTLPKPQGASGAGRRPTAILLFVTLTLFLIAAVEGSLRSFFNVYLDTGLMQSTSRIGLIMGVGQLLPAVAALTAPLLMGWIGAGRTFSWTSLAAGILLLPLAFIAHWAVAAFSFVGIIGAVSTSQPARNVFSQVCVFPEWRSSAAASATIGVGLGWAAMAATGGYIVATFGFTALFAFAAVLAFANALILAIYIRRRRYPAASIAPAN